MAGVNMLSIAIIDDAGARDTTRIFFDSALTIANIEAFLAVYAPLLDLVTGGTLESATVTLAVDLPAGLKGSVVADALKQVGANFGYSAADTTYRHTARIPAIDPALIVDGELNAADAKVVNLAAAMTAGAATFQPTDNFANDLLALLGAELSFRTK